MASSLEVIRNVIDKHKTVENGSNGRLLKFRFIPLWGPVHKVFVSFFAKHHGNNKKGTKVIAIPISPDD